MNAFPCEPAELARTLFEETADALFLFDPASKQILEVNPSASRLTGRARAELLQIPLCELVRAAMPGDELPLHDAVRGCEGLLLRRHEGDVWIPINLAITRLVGRSRPISLLRGHDLREQRDAQQQLRAKEAELGRLLAAVTDCIWSAEIDAQGDWHFRNFSPMVERITGRPASFFTDKIERWHEIIHPEDRANVRHVEQRLVKQTQPGVVEYRILWPDGAVRWVRDSLQPRRGEDGRLRIDAVLSDITERKETEAALFESRQRFEAFMNMIPMLGFMKDVDGRMIYVNEEFAHCFARPVEYFLGKLDADLWPAEIAQLLHATDLSVMAGTQPVEMREFVPTPDGCLREWWVIKFPFRDPQGRVFIGGIALDLTERTQLEESLRRSEARYHQLWQRNLAGGFRAALDGRILDCNDSFARLFGFDSRAEMLTHSTTELYFDLGVREEFLCRLRQSLHLTNYEMQMRRADGSSIWVLENVSLLLEQGQEILEGTIIDISERKRIEQALRASEANYRTLINHLDQGIFLKDQELRYVTVNPIFCAGVGMSEDQLRGKTISDLYPDHLTEEARGIEKRVLTEDRAIETEDVVPIAGKPRTFRVNRTPVKDRHGAVVGVLGICWDVTDQRELESQLRHVQKMDAIGQLAGGIAHDFNNLLTIMLGNLSYVLAQSPPPHPRPLSPAGEQGGMAPTHDWPASFELIRNAEKAGLRAAELTQTLLGFSRRAALATVPFNVNEAIDEVVRLIRSTLPANIELEVGAHPNLWLVQADPGQMNQVLTNLTLNARDALPHGGKIRYQTSHFIPDAEYLSSHVEAKSGEYVRLRVCDNGAGIPADLRERIFEPFFTTKEKGKGTGLGLAIVFSIVKQHNGWIVCENNPSGGTNFDLFLPRCPIASPVPEALPAPAPTRETILLIDDEQMIRQLGKTILNRAGYEVLTAENGAVGIEVLQAHADQIALIVLDAIMPRLSGRETLRELARIAPNISVLFSSGYSTEQMAVNEFPQVRGFLPKPYRAEQLIQKVTEILGETRRSSR